MNILTLQAPTIHEALVAARRRYGDAVVLLESLPPQEGRPAVIKVMIDAPLPQPAAATQSEKNTPVPAHEAAAPAPFGYTGRAAAPAPEVPHAAPEERVPAGSPSPVETGAPLILETAPRTGEEAPPSGTEPAPVSRGSSPRGRLFPDPDAAPAPLQAAPTTELERLLVAQLRRLHERLDQIERRTDAALIGASQRFTAHPLFARLLKQGLLPATATRLFDRLAAQGLGPETGEEALFWALACEMRRLIDVPAPKQQTGTIVLVGPSGAGKTSLTLKLARHPNFYGRRSTVVLVLLPEDEEATGYQSPVELYRRFGLPVQSAKTLEEVCQALERAAWFDQILIDTPPLPSKGAGAQKALRHLEHLLDPVLPLQVLLVLNATRALESFDDDYLDRLSLRPGAAALTHLDEAIGWGRVAEWMLRLRLPVPFASTSPHVPDGLIAFSPSWFVEELMNAGV